MTEFRKLPMVVEAMQFTDLESYLAIVDWMKACGDTYALANEVRYLTPIMVLYTPEGTKAVNPGEWIIRVAQNQFYVYKPEIFEGTYELVEVKA